MITAKVIVDKTMASNNQVQNLKDMMTRHLNNKSVDDYIQQAYTYGLPIQ